MSFEEFMDLALYGEAKDCAGYYQSSADHRSSRRGDYITSVEVGPLFGAVIARALDIWWKEYGCPNPFYVFDAGASVGTLARTIFHAEPMCKDALKYVLVERSSALIEAQKELCDINPNILSLKSSPPDYIPFEEVEVGVIIANELLDNLPVALFQKTQDGWQEISVSMEEVNDNNKVNDNNNAHKKEIAYKEILTNTAEADTQLADQFLPNASVGDVIPIQKQAALWLKSASEVLKQGRILIFDYGVEATADFAARPNRDWLRTYIAHSRGGSIYEMVSEQDITCEIAFDQLSHCADALEMETQIQTQEEFLKQWGIDGLVAEADSIKPSDLTNLETIELHSRKVEAEALLDKSGLGSHFVAQLKIEK